MSNSLVECSQCGRYFERTEITGPQTATNPANPSHICNICTQNTPFEHNEISNPNDNPLSVSKGSKSQSEIELNLKQQLGLDPNQPVVVNIQSPQYKPNNNYAILGFIFAFIFPLFGLIFSSSGINKAKELDGEGMGLAISGLVISLFSFVLFVYIVVSVLDLANRV